MIELRHAADLSGYNSFGIRECAARLVEVDGLLGLIEALDQADANGWPVTILGGGSNVVLTGPVDGLVICMRSLGRRVLSFASAATVIEAEAGENWHRLVGWSIDLGLSGLENLSLIPGTAGASPVQNIGAYGVELADVFDSLDAYDRETRQVLRFDRAACEFAYRDSIFKRHAGRFVILRVRLRLHRSPQLRVDYAPLRAEWAATGLKRADPRVIAGLVCKIRRSKLPDPARLGNAGSFFKNPLVGADQAGRLLQQWPAMPVFSQPDGTAKLAAGWLIDQAGWKGFRRGAVGVHAEQALVLVNHGGARGQDVMALAEEVQADVARRFGIELEMEPQRLGR